MDKERKAAYRTALADTLARLPVERLRVWRKKEALELAAPEAQRPEGRIGFDFLRVGAVYLVVSVDKGRLARIFEVLTLPPEAKNGSMVGIFVHGSLSEGSKSPGFGRRLLHDWTSPEAFAQHCADMLQRIYLPMAEAVLLMTPDLPKYVARYPDSFAYPLTVLAILDRLGISPEYHRMRVDQHTKNLFKREKRLNFEKILEGLSPVASPTASG